MKFMIGTNSFKKYQTLLLAICACVALIGLISVKVFNSQTQDAHALSSTDFNAGRIIDDSVFYNAGTMSAGEIQTFLNSKVPACDTQGTQIAREYDSSLPRAQYAASRGWHGPPYTCLKDFTQNTPQIGAASGLCSSIPARNNNTAAQMIYDVAIACGINPQVFLVLLEKEQSLVTDTWPLQVQYRSATGFACPDTAPCNDAYASFYHQVYNAARQFKLYQARPNDYNYRAGRTNTVYFHPGPCKTRDSTGRCIENHPITYCGSTQLYIENQATAALYIYTPYQPNQAALNNLRGTGDNCSSYGNRNFWRLFNEWFGSTLSTFTPVSNIYLSEGTYSLVNRSSSKVLDVAGASKSNGAAVQIWNNNYSGAQLWQISRDSENYYTFKNIGSGKVLDVTNGSTRSGTKLQTWDRNDTCAQKWAAITVDGSVTFLNKCSGLALDVTGGASNNGARMQLWHRNFTGAQVWSLLSHSSGPVSNGIYSISASGGLVIEGAGNATVNGTPVQIGLKNNSTTQKWHVSQQPNGYYTIRNTESGRLLDVAGASTSNGARIHLLNPNVSTCAQRWIITGSQHHGHTIQSACSSRVLDVQNGAVATPGASIQIWDSNGTGAQRWSFARSNDKIPNGTYSILTSTGAALDITGGRITNGTSLQLWSKNGSGAQTWKVERQANNNYSIINPISGRALDVRNAAFINGTPIQIWNSNKSCAQEWDIITRSDGKFEIVSACSGNWALDVAGGRISSGGTAVQIWNKNGSGAQVWAPGNPW